MVSLKAFRNHLKVWRQLKSKLSHSTCSISHATQQTADHKPDLKPNREPNQYESVIGLEIHAQIWSNSKLFSGGSTSYIGAPNSNVDLFDSALPGTLPVLNRRCVEAAVTTGLALNCQIAKKSIFERKHYFYADMPAGYQITQYRQPIATNGFIEFIVHNRMLDTKAYLKRSKLKQIQLEHDSGKSLQDNERMRSLVDLNRAGVALMEFVFEPDINTADEAVCLVKHLVLILKQLQVCSCKMSEGVLRVDANISVRKPSQPLGVRTEVKNLNSFAFIERAIQYEISRQISLIESGGEVVNETRMFDSKLRQTFAMRDKEVVQDYRFMPEPNLPPLLLCDNNDSPDVRSQLINICDLKEKIPELPDQERRHLIDKYNLELDHVFTLMNEPAMKPLFIDIYKFSISKKSSQIFVFLDTNLRDLLEYYKLDFLKCNLNPKLVSETIDLMINKDISERTAGNIIKLYLKGETKSATDIVQQFNWRIVRDVETIKKHCISTIELYPKIARNYTKTGTRKPFSVLIMNVLKQLDDRANADDIWEVYDQLLLNTNQ